MAKVPTTIALDKAKQNSFTKRVNKLKQKLKNEEQTTTVKQSPEAERGLIYLSHIPHGFYEQQILTYFKQFGKVTNVRVLRSHNTGRSKGAAFVEFQEPGVARIAAETMDNYLMFKRRIEAKYIEPEDKHKNLFKIAITPRKFPKQKRISAARQAKNSNVTNEVHQKSIATKLKKIKKSGMLDCLQINGLDFDLNAQELQNVKENLEGKKSVKSLKKPKMKDQEKEIMKKKGGNKKLVKEDSESENDDPEVVVSFTKSKTNVNMNTGKDKKSLKTIQKMKALKKEKSVINADVIQKITSKGKLGKKAHLTLDSDLVQKVDLVTKMKGKLKKPIRK